MWAVLRVPFSHLCDAQKREDGPCWPSGLRPEFTNERARYLTQVADHQVELQRNGILVETRC